MPFGFVLACCIRTFRLGRHAFNFRIGWIVAVDCSRAAKDQLFHTCPRGFFQNNYCPSSIDLGAFIRFLHGFLHACDGREMKDKVDTCHSFSDEIAIED